MKRVNFMSSLLIIFAVGFFVFTGVSCQGAEEIKNLKVVTTTLIATINLDNAKVVSQEGPNLKVEFDISNRIGTQAGVKYGIEIFSADGKELVYRKVFDETLFFNENEKIHKEVSFSVPDYLKGEFRINVMSKNEEGMTFGFISAGLVNFSGTGKYIKVDLDSCALNVSADSASYKLLQGVDVSPEEKIEIKCSADNYFDSKISVVPVVQTFIRTPFGKMISEEKISAIQFDENSKKYFEIVVPKSNNPQAYDARIFFTSENGGEVSNPIGLHYVVRGNSGTIQNAVLDRDVYKIGETASLTLFWTGRSDYFPGSRQKLSDSGKSFIQVNVVDSSGNKCADFFKAQSENNSLQGENAAKVQIKSECLDGKFIIQLVSNDGNVLDEKMIEFNKTGVVSEEKAVSVEEPRAWDLNRILPYVIAGLILIIGSVLIAVSYRRKSRGAMMSIFWLIIFSGFLLSAGGAKADTFVLNFTGYWDGHNGSGTATFTASMTRNDNRLYCPFELIEFYGTGQLSACNNTADSIFMDARDIYPAYNGEYKDVFSTRMLSYGQGMVTFRVENNPGNYSATALGYVNLMGMVQPETYQKSHSMPYSVVDCTPRQGECDPDTVGKSFTLSADVEASGLCKVGNPINFARTAPNVFSWTCSGTFGAPPSSLCTALRTPLSSSFCFGAVYDPTCSETTRTVPLSATGFGLRWKSTGANSCKALVRKKVIVDSVEDWVDTASPNWTNTAAIEDKTPVVDETAVSINVASIARASEYRYFLRCLNTEATTDTGWKRLDVNYTASCTGSCSAVKLNSVSCGGSEPSNPLAYSWVGSGNCNGDCRCKCGDGFCYNGTACISNTLGTPYCTPSPAVDCTGVCGPKTGEVGMCVADNACGGITNLPLSSCPSGCPANTDDCNDCDNANWKEVSP